MTVGIALMIFGGTVLALRMWASNGREGEVRRRDRPDSPISFFSTRLLGLFLALIALIFLFLYRFLLR